MFANFESQPLFYVRGFIIISKLSCTFLLLAREDGLTGEEELKMMLARRHTISNAMKTAGITSSSSSERSSLSPPPSDVTPSASHSDFNSEEILSDVTFDHENKMASYLVRKIC